MRDLNAVDFHNALQTVVTGYGKALRDQEAEHNRELSKELTKMVEALHREQEERAGEAMKLNGLVQQLTGAVSRYNEFLAKVKTVIDAESSATIETKEAVLRIRVLFASLEAVTDPRGSVT